MKLRAAQCNSIDKAQQVKALDWVARNVHVPLTEAQKVGIVLLCPWHIGLGKYLPSKFSRKLNAGDRKGAFTATKSWIYDGGKDCHIRSNGCYAQVVRRD